jgi:hypothetical protein
MMRFTIKSEETDDALIMSIKGRERHTMTLSKENYQTLKGVDLSEMGNSLIFHDANRTIETSDRRLLLIILNEEIASKGMDEAQDNVNEYGRRLYDLYDELLPQK